MFKKLGLSSRWCDLIYECISTVKATVLLNGIPGIPFHPSRGLRQGDPLSPYLFITALEGLSRLFADAEANNQFTGIKINKNCPVISHLLFADDCFIFGKADVVEIRNLLDILDIFSASSGQTINYHKSGVYFSKKVHSKHCKILVNMLKVKRISKNDKYLGTPLFFN